MSTRVVSLLPISGCNNRKRGRNEETLWALETQQRGQMVPASKRLEPRATALLYLMKARSRDTIFQERDFGLWKRQLVEPNQLRRIKTVAVTQVTSQYECSLLVDFH